MIPGPRPHWLYRDTWGNLGMRVAHRHEPHRTGIIVSDLGNDGEWVAEAEHLPPTWHPRGSWVGIGSPVHLKRLAEADR